MRWTIVVAAALALLASVALAKPSRTPIVLADFDGAAWPNGWTTTGTAFGPSPVTGARAGQPYVGGHRGRGFASSFVGGVAATGTLRSPPFRIERRRINFLLHAGDAPNELAVRLVVDGQPVRSATGTARSRESVEVLRWRSFDVADLEGKEAALEIADAATGDWGWVDVDLVSQSDDPPLPDPGDGAALARAEAAVGAAAPRVRHDPTRPVYHVLPPAQWLNDPNGPVYYDGHYHLFFQHNPYGDAWNHMHWGHVRSRDLVKWERMPIALAPSYDLGENHCFSGCAIVDRAGKLRLFYTSIGDRDPEQWTAVALDRAATRFEKAASNPILSLRAHGATVVDDWRDPFVFERDGRYWMVTGGHQRGGKGAVFLYRSNDLQHWTYVGSPFQGEDDNWECPLLFDLPLPDGKGAKSVLVYSPHGRVQYHAGVFDVRAPKLTSEVHGYVTRGDFYAPNVMRDPRRKTPRWLMWGWIRGFRDHQGWNGALTVPVELSLGADGSLLRQPAAELEALRTHDLMAAAPASERLALPLRLGQARGLPGVKGDALDLSLELDLGDAKDATVWVRRSIDGRRGLPVRYDGQVLDVDHGGIRMDWPLPAGTRRYGLRVLVDHSVVEIYTADGRASAVRVVDVDPGDTLVMLEAAGGQAQLVSARAHAMGSIW